MTVTGIETQATHPPKLAKELKQRIAELFTRYAFDEVMAEIARAKPAFDIHVSAHGKKRACPNCGTTLN